MRVSVQVCAALWWLCASGFGWPGQPARLVKQLTSETSPRHKREALRLLRSRYQQGERAAELLQADLTPLVHDADPDVRVDALRLLALVQNDAAPWRLARDDVAPSVRRAAVAALAAFGDVDSVLSSADDTDATVRRAAMGALGARADARVTPTLTRGLSDEAIEVRIAAAHALGRQPEPAALAALLRHVDDPLPELRAAIVDALAESPDLRAAAALAAALDDADEAVVLTALRGLLRSTPRPLPARVAALQNESSSPQIVALARALARRATRTEAESASAMPLDPPWLLPLELTADRTLTLAQSERALWQLEQLLPRGERLATDALVEWLGHAPASLRARIAALIEQSGGALQTPRGEPAR